MVRHILRRFQRAAVLQKYRDARTPERVIADCVRQPGVRAMFFHDTQHVAPRDGQAAETVTLIQRLKQSHTILTDRRGFQVSVQILLRFVMQPDHLFFVALFQGAEASSASLANGMGLNHRDHKLYKEGMGFQANVLKVMIASPSDVAEEREIVTDALYQWNNANAVTRELVLQPVKWDTHGSPQMGASAQSILNEHLLLDADIVVGIFGTRIGTATTNFISGSVEEIKRHVAAGKLAMLYFSHIPADPHAIDPKQWAALQAFKEECRTGGLYAEYASHEQLRTDFGHHLTIALNKPQYLWLKKPDVDVELKEPDLDNNERQLILAAAADGNGQIITGTTMARFYVQTNGKNFTDDTPRSTSVWKRVLSKLIKFGYLHQDSEEIYELTEDGFARADKEINNAPLDISLSFTGTPTSRCSLLNQTNRSL
jgi:hypothetical protein